MIADFCSVTGISRLLRHTGTVILILVLSLDSAGQVASVRAAPRAIEIIYRMRVYMPPDPLCVGKDYSITVRISADHQYAGQDGQLHDLTSEGISAKMIEAFATDESIAEVVPQQQMTGWDVESVGPGEAEFKLKAKKAGSTVVYFETYIAEAAQSLQEPYFGPGEPIKVVNCKYEVTMNAIDVYSGDVTIWTAGNLQTEITGDGGEMQGSGSFTFGSGFVGPPCSISYSEFENPTTITGHLTEDDQLVLDFEYEPGQITSQVSCPDGGGAGSQTVDLTNTGIASATFPATGGTRMFRFTYAGSDMPPGTMIINAQPVSEEAGG